MSTYAIKNFHNDLERLKHYGGTTKETAIRFAFQKLLDEYARAKDLLLIAEISLKTKSGKTVTPDGTLKDVLRLDHGYWESKDEADDIDEEIRKKFAKGYPNDNIIFEDSSTAVLIQHGEEVMRTLLDNEEKLDKLLTRFVGYERREITDFREAIEKFKEDIPKVTETLQAIIAAQEKTNPSFIKALDEFHTLCKASINPEISLADCKEMIVQHILSADIFNTIFDEPHFHQENNIARELNKVLDTFFIGNTRRTTLGAISHYYQTINAAAAGIADHHEKQKFLKVVYENFYKAYNPKAADRLGIVYTPNEIVQFMIKSTDWLLHKHFGKTLADKNVDILDPATGTGTFICDIIDFLPKNKLEYKYKNELHANELAILPYYIANLNIEYTYKQKKGAYAEFENLCLVDTLDNTGFHWVGKQGDLFGVSAENAARIRKQNSRKISVIIGNPPYNAKQENYNFQNSNRLYTEIDKRIKETYIKYGKAQNQNIVYDMFTRFYRWAMDRLNDNGIITLITNRSFIDGRAFDGFRKTIQTEFDFAYIIDTKSDVRTTPKISGTVHNVFGIQTGVAIMLLVKTSTGKIKQHDCKIHYVKMEDEWRKEEKLQWLAEHPMEKIEFEHVSPDKNNNWINLTESNWDDLLPIIDKDAKAGNSDQVIFQSFSAGIQTGRDEWTFDFDLDTLKKKMKYYSEEYNKCVAAYLETGTKETIGKFKNNSIKWTSSLEQYLIRGLKMNIKDELFNKGLYRPFLLQNYYYDKLAVHRISLNTELFGTNLNKRNKIISFITGTAKPFSLLGINTVCDVNFISPAAGGTFCLPFYRYKNEQRIDNITDWALLQFTSHYKDKQINKEVIFHYTYAALHHPAYRKKYELNLKREFPRIPLYDNFWQWSKWGEQLMQLHIEYEKAASYPLERIETVYELTNEGYAQVSKAKLKADKVGGTIVLDGFTTLTGIPAAAWEYKLGNRSALEWILDQYKEKKPSDPTIAEKFNTYRFANYKEQVIDLLQRVCTVSVETMKIVNAMPA